MASSIVLIILWILIANLSSQAATAVCMALDKDIDWSLCSLCLS